MTTQEQFAFNDIDDVKKVLLEYGLDLAHDVLHQAENVLKKSIEERKTGKYEFRKNEVGRIQVVCPFCGKVFFGGGSVLYADGREENCTMDETVRSWNNWKELHKKYCDECGAEMIEEGADND